MTPTPAIQCMGIRKTYGTGDTQVQALRGIDLEVQAGELLILDQTAGQCCLFGQDLSSFSADQMVHYRGQNIGFVFQSFNLIPTLTVAENVAIPLLINGVGLDQALVRAAQCLVEVGLESKLGSFPGQISGGQQQRVAIARALVHDPKLVVCDEPTSALDHQTGIRVMESLKKMAMDGKRSLVIVTHDARIFEFADRIAHMDDGHIEQIESLH